jgi:hypothetical protein
MDDRYIEAVARLLAAEAGSRPRTCERCGGRDVVVVAAPVDPAVGSACLPVAYCRVCDEDAPEAAGRFQVFDKEKGQWPAGPPF